MRHTFFVFDILHLISRNYFSFFFVLRIQIASYQLYWSEYWWMYSHGTLWMAANFLLMSFIRFRRSLLLLLLFCICSVRKKTKRNDIFQFFVFVFFFLCKLCKQLTGSWLSWAFFFVCRNRNWNWIGNENMRWEWGRGNSVTNLFNNRKPNKSNQMHSPHTHMYMQADTHTHTSSHDTQLTHTYRHTLSRRGRLV